MKILLNTTCFHSDKSTGIERFSLNIVQKFCEIESSAIVVSSEQIAGVPNTIISRLLALSRSVFTEYEYFIRALWDQTWLRYIVAKYKPDIIYFPIQDGMFYPPVKQIITVHDLHYLHFDTSMLECFHEIHPLRTKLYRYKMPHIFNCSSAIVAVSESTKQDIVASFCINPDKIHVIYNGYDEQRFHVIENIQPTLDSYSLNSGKYFLFVGSILKHKNIIRLLRAFAELASETVLVIAGVCKDSDCLEEVYKVAAELDVSERQLRYLEYVSDEDLPHLYNGAISYILPSLHEGFGVPIIEAMACGTPVITSNCSAMSEVAGDAALLVDPYSVESISSAMREILNNPRRADSLRQAGLERAKCFSWSASARKLYSLCEMITESKPQD